MIWLLLAMWPLVALLVGCVLGRSVAMEEELAPEWAPARLQRDTGPAEAQARTDYALAEPA